MIKIESMSRLVNILVTKYSAPHLTNLFVIMFEKTTIVGSGSNQESETHNEHEASQEFASSSDSASSSNAANASLDKLDQVPLAYHRPM